MELSRYTVYLTKWGSYLITVLNNERHREGDSISGRVGAEAGYWLKDRIGDGDTHFIRKKHFHSPTSHRLLQQAKE